LTQIDDHYKLTSEFYNKSEQLNKNEVTLPVLFYNILLYDKNKKHSRHGIYANGLLIESMRPKK